jgi:hypothetical protein
MLVQYSTLEKLVDVAKLYDDLFWQNYELPTTAKPELTYSKPDVPLRKQLTHAELQRLKAINDAFGVLTGDKMPSSKLLNAALTAEQLAAFERSCDEPVTHDEELYGGKQPPAELKHYNQLLRNADLLDYREDAMGQRGFGHKVETRYENALDYLADIYCADVAQWLDRAFDHVARDCDANAASVPRVLGSKSTHAISAALPKFSKTIKRKLRLIEALLVAAFDIAFDVPELAEPELSAADEAKLRKMLQQLHTRRKM